MLLFMSHPLIRKLLVFWNGNLLCLRNLLALGILFRYHHMPFLLHASGYSKLRPSQMVLLSDIKLVLLLGVFNKLREEIMMRLLLLLLI